MFSVDTKIEKMSSYRIGARFIWRRPKLLSGPSYEAFSPTMGEFSELSQALSKKYFGPEVDANELLNFAQAYPEIKFYRRRRGNGKISFAL